MLKRLAILGLYGALLMWWPCVAQEQKSKAHTEQNQPAQTQQPSPPAQTAIEPSTAGPHGNTKAGNAQQDPPKESWKQFLIPEWVIVYITAIYVFITALMFGAIKRQAGHMERQTRIQGDSVAVAQKSADAAMAQIQMMKSKERGRLRIEFGQVDLVSDPAPVNGYEVPFKLILDGATQVYIRENSCAAAIRETDEVPADDPWWRGMGLPTTITPEDRTFKGSMTILTEEKPWGEPPFGPDEARVSLVREEKLHVFVRALVQYDDIFGGMWEVRFNNKWEYNHDFFSFDKVDLSDGWWVSISDNGEYPAKQKL